VEPNNELGNATGNNAQSAYTWVKSDKAVKIPEDFQTIKEAIDKSNLDVYGGRATIIVSSGTYYESDLLIQNTLSSLTLSGDSSAPSIIGDASLVCVWGNADNVTVQGFRIQNSYAAIELQGDNCVAISNNLTGNNYGIYDKSYFNNTIMNNTISGNSGRGISLVVSSGHTIVNNTVANNQYGISLGSVNKTLVSNNKILSNYYGIWLTTSNDNTITNNTLSQNTYGFGVTGGIIQDFINTIDTTNTVEGKPVYYLINQSDLVIEPASFPSVGYLGIVNSTRITIRNLNITKSIQGIMLACTTNVNITNVRATYNHYGISLTKSNSTLIANSTASNDNLGIYTWSSVNNTVVGNTLSNDNNDGIYLSTSSTGNFVKTNAVTNTARGITLYYSNNNTLEGNTAQRINKEGLYIASSSLNIISNNIVSNCSLTGSYGGIFLTNAQNNTIQGNRIAYNYQGIRSVSSNTNIIYHNNLISNTQQVYSATSTNTWNKTAEGNYWSTYTGQDQNGDGIGDTPYTINANNKDNYPLMRTWAKAYVLNLRMMDWDMTDGLQGAYVYVNSESKVSNAQGWANWTTIARGFVQLKAKWHGGWINGTFSILVDCNRTVNIQGRVFDIVVTATENQQGATLQNVNVTVYNATSGLIQTAITDSAGKAYLNNVPNSTLVLKCYDANSLQIANASRTITLEGQTETIICSQNSLSLTQEWNILGDYSLSLISAPFLLGPAQLAVPSLEELAQALNRLGARVLYYLETSTKGLRERAKRLAPNRVSGERR
jgi:parallel beta-helix repeat protein